VVLTSKADNREPWCPKVESLQSQVEENENEPQRKLPRNAREFENDLAPIGTLGLGFFLATWSCPTFSRYQDMFFYLISPPPIADWCLCLPFSLSPPFSFSPSGGLCPILSDAVRDRYRSYYRNCANATQISRCIHRYRLDGRGRIVVL
jgi:hypothetical protein